MSAKRKPTRHGIAANKTAAAARLGISSATITAAQRAGCPACKPNGRIDCDALEIWLKENGASVMSQFDSDGGDIDYAHERAYKTRVERQIKQVQLARDRGDLIHVDEVRASITRTIAAAKGQFLTLGANIAPLVMVKVELTKAQADQLRELIDTRTRAIVTNLSNHPWNTTPPKLKDKKPPQRKRSTRPKAATKRKSSKALRATPGK